MNLYTTQPITIIKVESKSFTNAKGNAVEYYEAKLFDGEDVLTVGVSQNLARPFIDGGQNNVRGIAHFTSKPADKKTIKIKLEDFEVVS